VKVDKSVIKVDTSSRTRVPYICDFSDIVGGYMLAHTVSQQDPALAQTIMDEDIRYNQNKNYVVIFMRPDVAIGGLSLKKSKAKGIDVVEVKTPINQMPRRLLSTKAMAWSKLVHPPALR
jgi:dihydrolipoamide dehydrogenase